MLAARAVAVSASALLLLTACDVPFRGHGPTAGGPLSASVDDAGGGFSAARPRHVPIFTVTFGAFMLCLTEGHQPATISAVKARSTEASPFTAYLRTVRPAEVAATPPRDRADFEPHIAADGSPPAFDEPYVDQEFRHIPGSFSTRITGTPISEACDESDLPVVGKGQVPNHASTELMIAIPADKAGAEVDGFVIDYTVGGKKYRRTVPWRMVVCDVAGRLHNCGDQPG